MVLTQVREARGGEPRPVDAMLVERVRRDLERDRPHGLVAHAGEDGLEVVGLGGGPLER